MLMKTVLVAAAASLTPTASAWCNADPTTVSNFNVDNFAGTWHMQSSTFYGNDQSGCITLSMSEPDERDKLHAAVRSVQLHGQNPFSDGQAIVEEWTLNYDTSGNLKKIQFWIPSKHYMVLDTDYTNYAIVYQCTTNAPYLLNIRNDDIHIFTRSESVTSADLTSYKNTANDKIAGTKNRFEDLETKDCLAKTFAEKFVQFFTDPEKLFRKW